MYQSRRCEGSGGRDGIVFNVPVGSFDPRIRDGGRARAVVVGCRDSLHIMVHLMVHF